MSLLPLFFVVSILVYMCIRSCACSIGHLYKVNNATPKSIKLKLSNCMAATGKGI